MKKQKLIMPFLVLLLYSCQKDKANTDTASQVDVYVAGWEYNGTAIVAKYWKNDEGIVLTNGPNWAWASSIAVAGSDVYVAGHEFNWLVDVAKYWKNGQAITPGDGTVATSIAVAGSDVYVGGEKYNGSVYVAKYWKNGQAMPLTDGTRDAHTTAIVVTGSGQANTGRTGSWCHSQMTQTCPGQILLQL